MKLIIFDNGDMSVGIHPYQFSVDCPFELEDVDLDALNFFKSQILQTYKEFDNGHLYAAYDFELEIFEDEAQI